MVGDEERRWRPLSVRRAGGENVTDYETLHEGVPPWLRASLREWVTARLQPERYWSTERLQKLERELRLPLSWDRDPASSLLADMESDEDLFLDVVDYLLRDVRWIPNHPNYDLISIMLMLQEAGSAWEVVSSGDSYRLERRVLEGVVDSARDAFEVKGPGDYLRNAWTAAYGRHPNPTTAYSDAVKAVEAAARAIVTPKDEKATLGKMVSALRDAPQKWDIVLAARPGFDKVEVVGAMADLICQGQTDRHGTPNPTPVNQEQAEAALHLAVALVHWFASGSIRVRS